MVEYVVFHKFIESNVTPQALQTLIPHTTSKSASSMPLVCTNMHPLPHIESAPPALASYPVSLVESLAPADRGHAHFTTW